MKLRSKLAILLLVGLLRFVPACRSCRGAAGFGDSQAGGRLAAVSGANRR